MENLNSLQSKIKQLGLYVYWKKYNLDPGKTISDSQIDQEFNEIEQTLHDNPDQFSIVAIEVISMCYPDNLRPFDMLIRAGFNLRPFDMLIRAGFNLITKVGKEYVSQWLVARSYFDFLSEIYVTKMAQLNHTDELKSAFKETLSAAAFYRKKFTGICQLIFNICPFEDVKMTFFCSHFDLIDDVGNLDPNKIIDHLGKVKPSITLARRIVELGGDPSRNNSLILKTAYVSYHQYEFNYFYERAGDKTEIDRFITAYELRYFKPKYFIKYYRIGQLLAGLKEKSNIARALLNTIFIESISNKIERTKILKLLSLRREKTNFIKVYHILIGDQNQIK